MDKYNFGNKLCLLREEKGLTQKELAKILDVSDKAVSKWENGQSIPRIETLEKIADVLGVSIEALLSDDNTETERYRVKHDIFKNRNKNAKDVFYNVGIGSIALVLIACVFDTTVYFAFDKSNLADIVIQNITVLVFPLGLLTVYAFIKTFILGFIKGFLSTFKQSPGCIEAENKSKYWLSMLHKLSAVLTFLPTVIAVSSIFSDAEISVTEYIIIYFVLITLLSVYFFTMKYENIDLYFTENGMFEESIDYGDFYPYSSFEDITANANDFAKGLSDELKLSFTVDGKKFKTVITEEGITKVIRYLNINVDVENEKQPSKKTRILYYTFLGIGFVIMAFGLVLFMSNMQFGTTDVDYTVAQKEIVSLYGSTKVIEYGNKIFAFTEQNCAVDVFDINGNFLYANQVPVGQNGISDMYLKNNNLYIFDRDENLYRYDMNGNFLGRCTCECYDEGTYTVMFYDESDRRIDTRVFDEEDYMYIAYFDDNSYIVTTYCDPDYDYVLEYVNGVENRTKMPTSECMADFVDGAVYSESDEYYTFKGSLYSTEKGELYKESTFDWYRHSIPCTWLTGAFGMLFAFVSSRIIISIEKRKKYK
ncbi:MAG: helix-turn-helix domain-containing protein [Eubacterium sp.]